MRVYRIQKGFICFFALCLILVVLGLILNGFFRVVLAAILIYFLIRIVFTSYKITVDHNTKIIEFRSLYRVSILQPGDVDSIKYGYFLNKIVHSLGTDSIFIFTHNYHHLNNSIKRYNPDLRKRKLIIGWLFLLFIILLFALHMLLWGIAHLAG
jgi:hypothetical protein